MKDYSFCIIVLSHLLSVWSTCRTCCIFLAVVTAANAKKKQKQKLHTVNLSFSISIKHLFAISATYIWDWLWIVHSQSPNGFSKIIDSCMIWEICDVTIKRLLSKLLKSALILMSNGADLMLVSPHKGK